MCRRHVLPLLLLTALGAPPACDADGDVPPGETVGCHDPATLAVCTGDECTLTPCRGDQLCEGSACVPWHEVPRSLDFELRHDDARPRRITVEVADGGFPRAWVETLRFTFGDGTAGWGERLTHEYERSGIYPVELEVRLRGNRILRASRTAVIDDGLTPVPGTTLELTLNDIPPYLNGTIPYPSTNGTADPSDDYEGDFHLAVPTHGFTVDVLWREHPDAPLDRASLSLTADAPLASAAAGAPLGDRLIVDDALPRARWVVGAADAFPEGMVTLTLAGSDTTGAPLAPSTITFEVLALTPETDPFDREMVWLFRFDMDLFIASSTTYDGGAMSVESTPGSNGLPDFAEELRQIGAQGGESAAGATTLRNWERVGANAVYERWVIQEIIEECYRYYHIAPEGTPLESIAFTIVSSGDAGAPDPGDFDPAGPFSIMRFGGTLSDALGRSYFGVYNEERIDDTEIDLGVATSSLLTPLVSTPELTNEFDPIKPGTGTPVGEHELDPTVLAEAFDRFDPTNDPAANERYDDLARIADFIGRAIGAVTAHEMGHAMGLVPNDAPPGGLFGGRTDVAFMGPNTDSHHADYPGLNLMQAGGDFLGVLASALDTLEIPRDANLVDTALILSGENRLSSYELAYMNGQLIYTDFKARRSIVTCR